MEAVKGLSQLERKLKSLASSGSKQVARASLGGAVAPLRKSIRQGVNASVQSAPLRRAARLTIGSSVKKQPDGSYGAKAGFGVGKPSKKKRTAAHERSVYGQGGAKLARGVGLSSQNIHWFVLGTRERTQKTTGKAVGKIAAELLGVIPAAVNSSRGQMISEAARRAAVAHKKEAKKRR